MLARGVDERRGVERRGLRKLDRAQEESMKSPAAETTGLPPNVQPCMPGLRATEVSSFIRTAATGIPPPSALLITVMSPRTP